MYDPTSAVYTEKKMSYHNRSNRVWSMIKTRQDNNVIDRIDLVYAEIETERLGPIALSTICDEN